MRPVTRGKYECSKKGRTWKYGSGTDTEVFVVIEKGIPGNLMPSNAALEERQRWEVISYLRHRGGLPDPMAE